MYTMSVKNSKHLRKLIKNVDFWFSATKKGKKMYSMAHINLSQNITGTEV